MTAPPEATEPDCGTPAWWRDRYLRRQRQRRTALDFDKICSGALRIVDAEGLGALTMRRLAESLGTGPASLYRHVASREELIEELADQILADVPAPSSGAPWRPALEQLAREFRNALVSHQGLALAASNGPYLGPNGLRLREHFYELMQRAGWQPDEVLRAHMAIMHLVVSSALFTSAATTQRPSRWAARPFAQISELLAVLPSEELPMVELLAERSPEIDLESDFTCAFGCLLHGLSAQFG